MFCPSDTLYKDLYRIGGPIVYTSNQKYILALKGGRILFFFVGGMGKIPCTVPRFAIHVDLSRVGALRLRINIGSISEMQKVNVE